MQFVRQTRVIKVMNLDGKMQNIKRNHLNMLPASIRAVVCGSSKDERADKLVGKFAWRMIRVRILKIAVTTETC